tara:strand:+ start:6588 stop:7265 length:678 start_codon:yes stop_codon:yes gene_type:complete
MKVDIIIPEGLFDITLEQYQKFLQVNSEDELFLAQKCVEIFCNVPLIIVSKMSYKDVKNYATRIMSFFEDKPQLRKIHTMGDVEYGFIPNLEEISLGEYVDIDESINDWEKMHTTMAVLYRPIKSRRKDKYNIEEYEGTSDSEHRMKGLTMDVVLGALFFFYHLGIELSIALTPSLMQLEENTTSVQPQTSEESGDGTPLSIISLRAMLQDLKKLANSDFLPHLL